MEARRVVYALGRWLPYVTDGLAVGDLEYEQAIDFPGFGTGGHEGASHPNECRLDGRRRFTIRADRSLERASAVSIYRLGRYRF